MRAFAWDLSALPHLSRPPHEVHKHEVSIYGVNWTERDGGKRVKQFQVGRIGTFEWHQELHASLTAEAFRTEWEFCRSTGQVFEPDRYDGWSETELYPFLPASPSSDS